MLHGVRPEYLPEGFTEKHLRFYQALRSKNGLQTLGTDHLRQMEKPGIVCCCDGNRFDNLYRHLTANLPCTRGEHPTPWPFTAPGLPLLFSENSPVLKEAGDSFSLDDVMIQLMSVYVNTLEVNPFILTPHWPCKAAIKSGLEPWDALRLFVAGKRRLQQLFPGTTFISFHDLDVGCQNPERPCTHSQRTHYMPVTGLLAKIDEALYELGC